MPIIKKGSVVTVVDGDSVFVQKQGVLEEDALSPDQEVKVRFYGEYSYLFGSSFPEDGEIVVFPAKELRKDADFTPQNKADRLFGRNQYHHLREMNEPFDPRARNLCQSKRCYEETTQRILVNVLGAVCEYETCDECAKRWNGKMVEDFPVKKLQPIKIVARSV
jgi:hypothetical protein